MALRHDRDVGQGTMIRNRSPATALPVRHTDGGATYDPYPRDRDGDYSEYTDLDGYEPKPKGKASRRRWEWLSMQTFCGMLALILLAALAPMVVPIDVFRDTDEVTIPRDPVTRRFGYVYNDRLQLGASEENTPAKAVGLSRFIGRQITHVNRIMVNTVQEFRDVESRVGDIIQLRFAPSKYVLGAPIRVLQRIHFQSGKVIEAGATGVVTKPVGEIEGSIAEVKVGGTRWDALPGQVEVVEMTNLQLSVGMPVRVRTRLSFLSGKVIMPGSPGLIIKVPGDYEGSVAEVRVHNIRFDAMPGQLQSAGADGGTGVSSSVATEEVTQLLEVLGHQNYLPRMIAYGVDRLEFLAAASERDAEAVGVKPIHWKRILVEARRKAQLSGRGRAGLERMLDALGEVELLPKLVGWGWDRVDYLAKATPQDADSVGVPQERWQRVLREARRRVNDTTDIRDTPPPEEGGREVRRMLQDLGLARYWRRISALGLDEMRRIGTAPNLTSSLGVDWQTWNLIKAEARRRETGQAASVDPEVIKEGLDKEYELVIRRFNKEDSKGIKRK